MSIKSNQMKCLITILTLVIAVAARAQVNGFEPPYNPDSNADAFIGTHDLMDLLSAFGSVFEPENIYVSPDSGHMLVMAAESVLYTECPGVCAGMGHQWRMATMADYGRYTEPIPSGGMGWLNEPEFMKARINGMALMQNYATSYFPHINSGWGVQFTQVDGYGAGGFSCYCATQERPKVEYSYCEGTDIQDCADAKVADGWYPLGPVAAYHLAPDGIGSQTGYVNATSNTFKQKVQAFWRWAE